MRPRMVYHYTSHHAAMKILLEEQLWLTNIRFLNDDKEFVWLYQQIQAYMSNRATEGNPVPVEVSDAINAKYQEKPDQTISICVSCFSSQVDDVAQWGLYGDKGEGVAIGFQVNGLQDMVVSKHGDANLVVYGLDEWMSRLDSAIRSIEEEAQLGKQLLGTMEDPLARFAAFAKDHSFSNEREFRLALYGCPYYKYQFRNCSNSLIPYVVLPIERTCIADIMLGPKSAKESIQAWDLLLAQFSNGGTPDITVSRSQSGFR